MRRIARYFKEKALNFIDSFRNLNRSLLYVVVYDLVFFVSLAVLYKKLTSLFLKISEPILELGAKDFSLESSAVIKTYSSAINHFYISLALYLLLFAVIIIIIYAVTNLLIWSAITGTDLKKQKRAFFLKYAGLSIAWAAAWILLGSAVAASVKKELLKLWLIPMIFLYGHLTTLAYMSFFKKRLVGKSIKSAFGAGFSKISKFIAPYIFALLAFAVLNLALSPLKRAGASIGIAYFILFIFYFAWLRIYIYSFARDLIK